eukprot:TRINITY_DN7141_c0_g1_i1.p1 TRINITY_DN7141_c0_g1~~TRINITY_DN7141_c0_g1_i1.p1  ORF type:complete len:2784 (+),score=866.69 TRINITY_DN7141_c0_g1_i1:33-8354(+)
MNTPPSDAVGGLSPDWYCSGGTKEDELESQLRNLQAKVARLELIISEKDKEIEEISATLRDERRLEAESLNNMRTGSEKLLEQKKIQVQQLNDAIRKLNESLRKKDQQLSTIVAHNLRADGAYTETAAELSELKLNLRHAEADRSKEKVTIQRLEAQVAALGTQNQRLDELIQQYRLELTRKENALSTQQRNEENQGRVRHLTSMEVIETLGETTARLTRLENDLKEQESILLSGTGVHARCTPSVARPGQRVRVSITCSNGMVSHAPTVLTSSNAIDFSPIRQVSSDSQYTIYTMLFTTGSKEGTSHITFVSGERSAQATVAVEGGQTVFDISGSEVFLRARCFANEPLEVHIATRDAAGELVTVSLRDEELDGHDSPLRRSSVTSGASTADVSYGALALRHTRLPTVVVAGACILEHVTQQANGTHRLLVCPLAGRAVSVQLVSDMGVICSACSEVKATQPDYSRVRVVTPSEMTVGDRGTVKIHLYDASGAPCPPPVGVLLSDFIRPSCGADDATDINNEIITFETGVYGFHCVPLAVGTTVLNVAVGDVFKETLSVHVVEAGGEASLDNFMVSPPANKCVRVGSDVTLSVLFNDERSCPAASAPAPDVLVVDIEGDAFAPVSVVPDPHTPSSLLVSLKAERGGEATITISCKGGARKSVHKLACIDREHAGCYAGIALSLSSSVMVPGGVIEVFASPKDSLGNILTSFPEHAEDLYAVLEGTDIEHHLVPCPGGRVKASIVAPLNQGYYTVSVGKEKATVQITASIPIASKCVADSARAMISRLPDIMYSLNLREHALRNALAEASMASQEWERAKARASDLKKITEEEKASAAEAAIREREALQAKIEDLKASLAAERREEKEFQKRWEEREQSLEKERAQRSEDRRLWLEERNRLTNLDEENQQVIAALRKQITDMQAKSKQQHIVQQRRFTEHTEECQKKVESAEAKWEIERATYEVRCNKVAERVEGLKDELEAERRRADAAADTINKLEHVIASMKTEAQELQHALDKTTIETRQAKEELVEATQSAKRRIVDIEKHHSQLVTTTSKSHREVVESLETEISRLKEQHKEELDSLSLEWEAKKAATVSHFENEIMKLEQEKEELALTNDDLTAQIRSTQREILAEQDAKENAGRLWETEKRSLERMLEERNQIAREADQRCADAIETNKSLLEHDRALWQTEKQMLHDRLASIEEEKEAIIGQWEAKLEAEKQTLELEKTAWAQEKQELLTANAATKDRLEEMIRMCNKALDEEKLQIDDERRRWMNERADFRARLNDLQQAQDETARKYSRMAEELKSEMEEEREEWHIRRAELESELQDTKAYQSSAVSNAKKDLSTLKAQLEAQRQEATREQAKWEQELKQRDEQADVERRKMAKELQVAREDFEVEREKYKRETISLRQQVENLQAALEDAHSRHVMKMEEIELERQKWAAEKTQLRERLAVIEAGAAELAEEHKKQVSEQDKQLANVRKEADAVLQAKIAQMEAHLAARLQQEAADMEAKHAHAAAEWEAELARAAESHRAEVARIQATADEREQMADAYLESAKDNYKAEIEKLEAELAKAKAEKVAAKQRAETERSEERQRLRQEQQQLLDEHEKERRQWETRRDELLESMDDMKLAHQREVNELNRQLQRAGLDEVESLQEESRKEMASLRTAWQKQLSAAHEAHERDRASFAKEREEWRAERTKLWNERNSSKQLLEASLASAEQARDDAEALATQRVEEITKLLDRNTELEDLLQKTSRKLEERQTVEHQLLEREKQDWGQEKRDLHEQLESLRKNLEHHQSERLRLQQDSEELQRQSEDAISDLTSKHQKQLSELQKDLDLLKATNGKLQREVSKHAALNEQLQKRMDEDSKKVSAEAQDVHQASMLSVLQARERIDELEADLVNQKQKLQDANTIHTRQVEEFEEEKEQLVQDYEDLRTRFSTLQADYNDLVEKNALETQKLREASTDVDSEWATKEEQWTQTLEQERQKNKRDAEHAADKLESVQRALQAQLDESERGKADLRRQLEDSEAARVREKEGHAEAGTWQRDKLEAEKQSLTRDKDHALQQLESYKKLLQETQHKQQESLEAMSTERKQWLSERVKLREEATSLRNQLTGMEQSFIEQAEHHAKQLAELTQKEMPYKEVSNSEIRAKNEELSKLMGQLEEAKKRLETEGRHRDDMHNEEKDKLQGRLQHLETQNAERIEALKKSHATEVKQLMSELEDVKNANASARQRAEQDKTTEREMLMKDNSRLSTMLGEERNKWSEEKANLLSKLEQQQSAAEAQRRSEQAKLSQLMGELRDHAGLSKEFDQKRKELEKQLSVDLQKGDTERENFRHERAAWHDERRGLWKERDALKSELEDAKLKLRTSRSEAALAEDITPDTDLKTELLRKNKELDDVKSAWSHEKKEFDSFLEELDKEKERERQRIIEETTRSWAAEREELKREVSRLSDFSLQLKDLQTDRQGASSTGTPSPTPSPALSFSKRSKSPAYNLDELKAALIGTYSSTGAAVSSMLRDDGTIDNSSIYDVLKRVGLEQVASSFIQAAVEAGDNNLLEGVKKLLAPGSKYEAQVKEYELDDDLSRQLAEQSRKVIEKRSIALSAKQVVPSVTITKVRTSSSTVQSNRYKSFAYFGVEVTDGVRVGHSKQEYFGVKVVNVKGAAEQAGIEPGDVMKEIAGSRVSSLEEFRHVMETLPSSSPLYVVVDRDGTEVVLTVKPHSTNARPGSLHRYTQAVSVSADADYRSRSGGSDLSTVTSSTNRTRFNSVPFR